MRLVIGALVAAVLICPRTSAAQAAPRPLDGPHLFIDLNFAGQGRSAAASREFESLFLLFSEQGLMRATYPKPSGARAFPIGDVGGGFMWRRVAFGATYSRTTYANTVALATTIPDPTFLKVPASAIGAPPDQLERREEALHVSVSAVPVQTRHAELRFVAGPSLFWYSADMVKSVVYAQTSDPTTPHNVVTITGFTSERAHGRAAGFHVGTEFTYFVMGRVGVAFGARFSRATVAIAHEPLSTLGQKIRVGGARVFLGLRYRFGS